MKKALLALLALPLAAADLSYQRESNLLQGLNEWLPVGKAEYVRKNRNWVLKNGVLEHFLDRDNAEHAAQDCTFPFDKIMEFKVRAKGTGSFRLGIDSVRMGGSFKKFTMTTRFTYHTATIRSPKFELTDKWQNYVFQYQETDPGAIVHNRVFVEPAPGAQVELLSASMVYKAVKDPEIVFEPNSAVAVPGEKMDFVISCSKPDYPLNLCIYDGHHRISNGMDRQVVRTGKDGKIRFGLTMVSASFEGMRVTASDPVTGAKKSFFITEVSPAEKAAFEKAKLRKKLPFRRMLFLGDSLTDYDRGRNYLDLLKLSIPADTVIVNAGIGGDYLGRVLSRMQGKKKTFSLERYNGIFEPKPDIIFTFLGANDTKAPSKGNFMNPVTPPDLQYKQYKELIRLLREKSGGAKIVFILPTSGYYEDQLQAARRRVGEGKGATLFNRKDHVENYIKVLKKIAAEEKIGIVDAYTPTRDHSDRRSLFISNDGIHMTLKGHWLLSRLILDYLTTTVKK